MSDLRLKNLITILIIIVKGVNHIVSKIRGVFSISIVKNKGQVIGYIKGSLVSKKKNVIIKKVNIDESQDIFEFKNLKLNKGREISLAKGKIIFNIF